MHDPALQLLESTAKTCCIAMTSATKLLGNSTDIISSDAPKRTIDGTGVIQIPDKPKRTG